MQLTPEQVKGRIKNIAKEKNIDARVLIRIHMMERFLERISVSKYSNNFIVKGGMLVASMVGVSLRSTMDIDTSIRNQNLSITDAMLVIDEISNINLNDGITFEIKNVSPIMGGLEYPGIRFHIDVAMGRLIVPIKIDISTGDIITPHAIKYEYKLLLENRSIILLSYNLETILAEKLQTIFARNVLNTRMRDFYDIKILLSVYEKEIDKRVLKDAFYATCKKRNTENLIVEAPEILRSIKGDYQLRSLWSIYQKKFPYAHDISYTDVIESIKVLWESSITAD